MSLTPGDRIQGITAPLPPGEHVRWEGRPAWFALAWRAFHLRTVLLYFGVLMAWQVATGIADRRPVAVVAGAVVFLGLLAAGAALCSLAVAWLSARTTVYAITDRRVVMRIGIVVPSIVNLPFRLVESIDLRRGIRGTGDLVIRLSGEDRLAWFMLFPHNRPWHFSRPEPMLRALPDAERVGVVLTDAVRAMLGDAAPVPAPEAPPTAHLAARPSGLAAAPLRRGVPAAVRS